jgi:hypothetical protein
MQQRFVKHFQRKKEDCRSKILRTNRMQQREIEDLKTLEEEHNAVDV